MMTILLVNNLRTNRKPEPMAWTGLLAMEKILSESNSF